MLLLLWSSYETASSTQQHPEIRTYSGSDRYMYHARGEKCLLRGTIVNRTKILLIEMVKYILVVFYVYDRSY